MSQITRWPKPLAAIAFIATSFCWPILCQPQGTWTTHGPYSAAPGTVIVGGAGEVLLCPTGDLQRSDDGGVTWRGLGLRGAYRVISDPTATTLYAQCPGTNFRSTDAGVSWTPITPVEHGIYSLAMQTGHPEVLYAGSDPGLYRSDDSGVTWQDIGLGLPYQRVMSITPDPISSATVYVCLGGTPGGIYRSRDAGLSWQQLSSDGATKEVLVDPQNPETLYVWGGYPWGIYRSMDSGVTWASVAPGDSYQIATAFALDPLNTANLYAATLDGSVYWSSDRGTTWAVVDSFSDTSRIFQIIPSPVTAKKFYLLLDSLLIVNLDRGRTWYATSLVADCMNTFVGGPWASDSLFAGSSNGAILSLSPGGTSWSLSAWPFGWPVTSMARASNEVLASYSLGAVVRSKKSGEKWVLSMKGLPKDFSLTPYCMVVDSVKSSWAYVGGHGGLYRSKDGGKTWKDLHLEKVHASIPPTVRALVADPFQSKRLVSIIDGAGIALSADAGKTWTVIEDAGIEDPQLLAASPNEPGVFYAAGIGVAKSTDAGSTWSRTPLPGHIITSIATDPAVPGRLFVGLCARCSPYARGVRISEDGGASWASVGEGLPEKDIRALYINPASPETLYAAVNGGTTGSVYSLSLAP